MKIMEKIIGFVLMGGLSFYAVKGVAWSGLLKDICAKNGGQMRNGECSYNIPQEPQRLGKPSPKNPTSIEELPSNPTSIEELPSNPTSIEELPSNPTALGEGISNTGSGGGSHNLNDMMSRCDQKGGSIRTGNYANAPINCQLSPMNIGGMSYDKCRSLSGIWQSGRCLCNSKECKKNNALVAEACRDLGGTFEKPGGWCSVPMRKESVQCLWRHGSWKNGQCHYSPPTVGDTVKDCKNLGGTWQGTRCQLPMRSRYEKPQCVVPCSVAPPVYPAVGRELPYTEAEDLLVPHKLPAGGGSVQ